MSHDNGVLLDVQGLEYAYGSRQAVCGVSFRIRRGEIFGLLGPNGAGKTTTIACLCGILGNWRGQISFHGQPFAPARRAADRRRLGVVPQELAVYDMLSARENLQFFGRLCGLGHDALEAAVGEALELAGLEERADDRVSSYSGGMKRRLNLVAGQLHKPDLLLLDEPTVGVDPQARNHIFESLVALKAAGSTLVYTTHYMEEAQRLCDQIAIINEGRVAAIGTADELSHAAGIPGATLEDVFLKLTGRRLRDEQAFMHSFLAAWTIAAKDLRAYFRDRVGMVLGFLLPIALISVFGYLMAVAFAGERALPKATLWFVDEDDSPASRRFVSILRESEMLKVLPREGEAGQTADELRGLVQNGDAPNALIIPKGYGEAVQEKKLPRLTLLRDPGRVLESRMISIALSQTVLAASSGELLPTAMGEAMRRNGMEDTQVKQLMDAAHSLELVLAAFARAKSGVSVGSDGSGEKAAPEKSVVAALAEAINQLIPIDPVDILPPSRPKRLSFQLAQSVCGMTVMMLMFGMLSCSLTLLAERDSGTLRRLLTVPVPRNSIYWGKYLFVSIIGVLQLIVMFLYGNTMFSIGAFRDVPTLAAISLTWTAAASAFGMLIAAWARSTKQAEGLATVLILLMSALGGCWFPIQTMDLSLAGEIITRSTLTYWAMEAYQGLFWNQLPWYDPKMLKCLAILWGFTTVASVVALWLFRRRYMAG